MNKILIYITVLILTWFIIFQLCTHNTGEFFNTKVTDWISAFSSIVAAVIAYLAYNYAKSYLKQERHKNATSIALDIIHADFIAMQDVHQIPTQVAYFKNYLIAYQKNNDYEKNKDCLIRISSAIPILKSLLDQMRAISNKIDDDILKAAAVGCKFKSNDNSFSKIVLDFRLIQLDLGSVITDVEMFLLQHYGYNFHRMDNHNDVVSFVHLNSFERDEFIDRVLPLAKQISAKHVEFQSKIFEARSNPLLIDELFDFN